MYILSDSNYATSRQPKSTLREKEMKVARHCIKDYAYPSLMIAAEVNKTEVGELAMSQQPFLMEITK